MTDADAPFAQTNSTSGAIYIGWTAPGDNTPLSPFERRVKSVEKDLYLYGDGRLGNAFAAYDFLEQFLDCRFYTLRGVERIPQNLAPQWEKLDKSIVPSFPAPYVYGGIWAFDEKSVTAFERRARTYLRRGGVPVIGPDNYHAPAPPGAALPLHLSTLHQHLPTGGKSASAGAVPARLSKIWRDEHRGRTGC